MYVPLSKYVVVPFCILNPLGLMFGDPTSGWRGQCVRKLVSMALDGTGIF